MVSPGTCWTTTDPLEEEELRFPSIPTHGDSLQGSCDTRALVLQHRPSSKTRTSGSPPHTNHSPLVQAELENGNVSCSTVVGRTDWNLWGALESLCRGTLKR